MTAKTMAEVLADADDKWCRDVTVSSSAAWAQYMSEALTAAGFGLVADAWDLGCSDGRRYIMDRGDARRLSKPDPEIPVNPYRRPE